MELTNTHILAGFRENIKAIRGILAGKGFAGSWDGRGLMIKTDTTLIYRPWGFGRLGFTGRSGLFFPVMEGRVERRAIYVFLPAGERIIACCERAERGSEPWKCLKW
jgi:hypothetical protein